MTYTTYTATQAAARARNTTSWAHWMCLSFVKNMITPTVNSSYYLPHATAAWSNAQKKHTTGVPPAGVPVYWRWVAPDGRDLGHIAVSLGNGYVRSTDYPAYGQVGTVNMWALANLWGLTYRGWSEDYAGLTIPGIWSTSTAYSPIPTTTATEEITMSAADDIKTYVANLLLYGYTSGGVSHPGIAKQVDSVKSEVAALSSNLTAVKNRVFGMMVQRYYVMQNGAAVPVSATTTGAKPAHVLDNIDGDYLRRKIEALEADVTALKAQP